jgi:hypothetical protein
LGLLLLLGAAAIGPLFGYPFLETLKDIGLTTIDLLTIRLILIVVLIMLMGELMRQSASMKGMVDALQALIPNGRIVIAALPALVGFLPMVGGAMFSAPMVDEVGENLGANEERKVYINYWFRHIWEPIFPLYPSMVLAAGMMGLTPVGLIRSTWPLPIAGVVSGLVFALIHLPRRGKEQRDNPPRLSSLRTLLGSIWPVLLVILLSLVVRIDERVNLIISLLITITLLMLTKRIPARDIWVILRQRIPWNTLLVIVGALAFRDVLDNSGAVVAVSEGLTGLRIPPVLIAFGIPFIAGLLTGLMSAAYGIGFPVALPLVATSGGAVEPGWAAWLIAGGFLGTMLSPVHLCLALTRVYFKAEWGPVYRLLVPSAMLMTTTAAVLLILR